MDRKNVCKRSVLLATSLYMVALMPLSYAKNFDWLACDEVHEFPAEAYQRESDTLLYQEQHRQCYQGGRLVHAEMRYRTPQGGQFAEKWLDYTPGAATPDFQLTDRRTGYTEGARRQGSRVELNRRAGADARSEQQLVRVPDNAVIDSGFDEFVRAHIGELRKGDTVRLKFLVAGELDTFSFKAHGLKEVRWRDRDAYHLRVEHDSFLVRMLLDPILLWYDAASLRLLEYRGISNIKSPQGDRYDARIVYPPDRRRVTIPEAGGTTP